MENAKFFTKKYEKIKGKHFNLIYDMKFICFEYIVFIDCGIWDAERIMI